MFVVGLWNAGDSTSMLARQYLSFVRLLLDLNKQTARLESQKDLFMKVVQP